MSDTALVKGVAGLTTDDQTNAAERRAGGEFVRPVSKARNWISTEDGAVYKPATGRYHLYVAYNCPWCHRVLLGRAVAGLEAAVTVDVCFPSRSKEDERLGGGLWKFAPSGSTGFSGNHVSFPSCTSDTVCGGKDYIKEIYEVSGIENEKSVPILFDKETMTIVSNESSEILRMFGTVMKPFSSRPVVDLYPVDISGRIDEINDWVYTDIANGSYKAGFSSNQQVYEEAYRKFFGALDKVNGILSESVFIASSDHVTEADLRLFPPLFRFDPIYYSRFKLSEKFLWEYPHIWRWVGDMMRLEGMEACCNAEYLAHCKQGYFGRTGNGVIPVGPCGYPEIWLKDGVPFQKK